MKKKWDKKKSYQKANRILAIYLVGIMIATGFFGMIKNVSPDGNGTYPPPKDGDWVIKNETVVWNETRTLNGNLIIENGGNLTLRNVTLIMNCSEDGEFGIVVRSGGKLFIYDYDNNPKTKNDRSNITANNTEHEYKFIVTSGAEFEMKNSELSECGYNWSGEDGSAGLTIKSDNTIIENSSFYNNFHGICFYSSNNNTISNCNISNNNYDGIDLSDSNKNTISNCNISNNNYDGILLSYSSKNTIFNNIFINRGIRISGNTLSHFIHSIENNTVNNKALLYYKHKDNIILNGIGAGQIILANCSNFEIKNININNIYAGIVFGFCKNNKVLFCNISNNDYGIYLMDSSENTISNCNFSNNDHGIYLRDSSDGTITNNTCSSNNENGIYLDSSSNNKLTNNTANSNNGDGIYLRDSNDCKITNNICSANNNYGINIGSSTNNTLTNNTANLNNGGGIYLSSSNSNTLTNNSASNNGGSGISLAYSHINKLTNNSASGGDYGICIGRSNSNILMNNSASGKNGIYIDWSNSNTLTNNSASGKYGIHLYESNSNTLMNNYVSNNGDSGIYLYESNNNKMMNNIANSNRDYGINLFKSDNNTITNNTCSANDYGIVLGYSSSNTLTNNTVNSNKFMGIWLLSSSDNTLINNTCSNNDNSGIYLHGSKYNIFYNNTCSSNHKGIYLISDSSHNTLSNNTCSANNDGGISIYSSYCTITNNNCSLNNGCGIYLSSSSHNALLNNTCSSNNYGIFLGDSRDSTITNNTCFSNNENGICLYQYSDCTITNNTCFSNKYDILIRDSSDSNIITNNTCSNSQRGIFLYKSRSNTLMNNTCSNSQRGIFLNSSSSNILTNNTCNSNNDYGIYLSFSSSNTLTNNTCSNSQRGIFLDSSSSNILTNNTCNSNNDYGIYLFFKSDSNRLTNNTCANSQRGIFLDSSSSNILTANQMINCSIFINGDFNEYWNTHEISTSNTANGKSIYYWKNKDGGIVPTGSGQVILANCTNITIKGQNITNGYVGILLGFTSDSLIINNNCSFNVYGIYLETSKKNVIALNIFIENAYQGVFISKDSSSNKICQNYFLENNNGDLQGFDNGMDNQWNTTEMGNFWSDFDEPREGAYDNNSDEIVDTPYNIPVDSADYYPLINQPEIDIFTVYKTYPEYGPNITSLEVSISGNCFIEGMKVNLTNEGEENIQGTDIELISKYYITAKFNLTGKTLGFWNVVVTLPDGEERRLENGFEIRGFVYGIFPKRGFNLSREQRVMVYGFGFTDGIVVKLSREDDDDIVGEAIEVLSLTRFTTKFNLTGRSTGSWDLVVTLPSGERDILANAFKILDADDVGNLYRNITIKNSEIQEYEIGVSGGSDLFITLQKITLITRGNSWSGKISLFFDGEEIASASGSHDHILHIVDPEPGVYVVKLEAYQAGSGILVVGTSLPELPLGEWVVGMIHCSYGSVWYQVEVLPDQDILYLEAEALGRNSYFKIYHEKYGSSKRWVSAGGYRPYIEISRPTAGTYIVELIDPMTIGGYHWESEDQSRDILIYADTEHIVDPPPDYLPFISYTSPGEGGNTGLVTIEINGQWLDSDANVSLIRSGHEDIIADNLATDGSKLSATFNLTNKAIGEWNLIVRNQDGRNATAPASFIIEEGKKPKVWAEIIGREKIRVEVKTQYQLRYGNSGNTDVTAPLFIISSSNAKISLSRDGEFKNEPIQVLGIGSSNPLGILSPGSFCSIPFYLVTHNTGTNVNLDVSTFNGDDTQINWDEIEPQIRPDGIEDEIWEIAWKKIKFKTGNTWENYLDALGKEATYLGK